MSTMGIEFKEYTKTKHTGISIHKDGLRFLFVIKINGKLYRKTFKANPVHGKADRLKTAYVAKEAFYEDKLHSETITADTDATVGDYWEKVKASKTWNAYRVKKYNYFYNRHLSDLGVKKIRDIKPAHFTSLNTKMKDLSPRTRLEGYEILKPIFEMAIEDEIIKISPIKKSHIPKRKQLEEKKFVTEAEAKYRKVYEAINTLFGTDQVVMVSDNTKIQCQINPHHQAAFLFGFHGRRLQETLNLEWTDIDFENKSYVIRGKHSKVNTDMNFTLSDDIVSALLEFRDTSGKIFTVKSLDCHHQKIRDYTDIPEFSFHWMRNLSVSALSAMGVEITHLSAMLGHTDGSTIRKYLSLQREASTTVTNKASAKLLGI